MLEPFSAMRMLLVGMPRLAAVMACLFQLLIFAVDGQEILGSGQGEHQLLLFLTGVAGDVDVVHALIDDLCAQQEQTVDDLGHALLVAGDGLGRDDDERGPTRT